MSAPDAIEQLAAELEALSAKLRAGRLDQDEAARLVERCADLAARLASELDARSRAGGEPEGQERLL